MKILLEQARFISNSYYNILFKSVLDNKQLLAVDTNNLISSQIYKF